MTVLVHAKDLKKSFFEGKHEVPALRGVDLNLTQGEFVALIGPSGSGKSTFLNLIGTLDSPTSGKLEVLGHSVAELSREKRAEIRLKELGFVFQAYNLIPVLTAQENIEFILELQGVSASERRNRSKEVLEELSLAELSHRRPQELSGGQQQRVAVARAIVSHPKLVLADEPTANLDGTNAGILINLMNSLRKRYQTTFLFSTHDPRVISHAERVITLTDGKITSDEQAGAKSK